MDKRFVHKLSCPMFGMYSFEADAGLKLTDDCGDLAKLLGRTTEEMAGRELSCFISNRNKEDAVLTLNNQIECLGEIEMLLSFTKKDGTDIYVLNRGMKEKDLFGMEYVRNVFVLAEKTGHLIAQLKDELELYRARLYQTENRINILQICAEQDSLTGILNAGTTRRLAEEYIAEPQSRCAMLIIDVDDFKRINDRYGHMTGDQVLKCAAEEIKKLFRSNDIVGRVGGDEFLVLMKEVSDMNIVALRCSQIISSFNDMSIETMRNDRISCSVGAAVSNASGVCYEKLFLCADKALYRTKDSGGNGYSVVEYK